MFGFLKKNKTVEAVEKILKTEDYKDILPVAEYFKNETGVTFDRQTSILQSKVTTFCKQREIYSFIELLNTIEHNKNIKQELIDYLTTNETYFYREFKQIAELVDLVKKADSKVDILCAPSSTGEESYSIAIALLEAGVPSYHFHITGIDINSDALTKANKSIYRERNVRNLPSGVIEKYFTKHGDEYILNDSLKSLVNFKLANIFDSSFKQIGKFDFIFSRNMLIYFDNGTRLKAKEILESMRKDDKYKVFFGHADLF
ncbi:protein-glutamate O-methyltransferase CheR [Candidatus Sulfurimonas marisnigri]|uniref:Protein-glutamate O-methyltransferase CheR n=1 Tax=Candidatus Sulfurimonas marisnigri TaxID=2740405 RepID=A0A7S7M0R6_9BACT|nr:CheR family methyltransferase [Candidatus Sulfurimonas marisnigri]QOY54483.1 protein-glutamate O-methyltransferase CheR [Candidatus Sulfurimonas marisnigri]